MTTENETKEEKPKYDFKQIMEKVGLVGEYTDDPEVSCDTCHYLTYGATLNFKDDNIENGGICTAPRRKPGVSISLKSVDNLSKTVCNKFRKFRPR